MVIPRKVKKKYVYHLFIESKLYVFNTKFNITKLYIFCLYNLILYKGTKGMVPNKKKAEIKKKKALEHKHRM